MPDALLRWPWRLVAVVLIAALGYIIWRGYQQPELILDFAGMRLCYPGATAPQLSRA